MKRILSACLFLLFFSTYVATGTIIDRPPFSISNTNAVEIETIILSDTATIIHMTSFMSPGSWFSISSDTYLKANGQKQSLKWAEGIELNKHITMNENGQQSFVLCFSPIDTSTATIDFFESDCESCFKIWGIELKSAILTNKAAVPQEAINAAITGNDDAQLNAPGLEAGYALLTGQFVGYQPEIKSTVRVFVDNPITGIQEEYDLKVTDDGCFADSIPLICTMQVLLRTNEYNKYILLSPGQTSSVYFDWQSKWRQIARLRSDKAEPSRWIYFSGANAAVNNQLSTGETVNLVKNRDTYARDILGMSAGDYKKYILSLLNDAIKDLENSNYSPKARSLATLFLQYDAMYELMFADSNLESAFRKAHNLNYDDKMEGYVEPAFDATYYSFLKDFPINNPVSLYCALVENIVNSCKYLNRNVRKTTLNYLKAYMVQSIIDSKQLTKEEKDCADFLIREDYNNWDKKRVTACRKELLDYCKRLTKTGKLTETDQVSLNEFKTVVSNKKSSMVDMIESLIITLNSTVGKNPGISRELLISFQPIFQPAKMDSSFQANLTAFSRKFSSQFAEMQRAERAKDPIKYLAGIIGTDKGILFDLLTTQQACACLEQQTPISAESLKTIAAMENPFYSTYLETKNNQLLAKLEANRMKGGYKVYDTPSTTNDSLFAALLKPFAGKVILVDFWNTWCAPCRSAMKQLEPAKESFKGKDVVFLYLADESSPLGTWQNMIPDIHGEHYRLPAEQASFLKKKFGVKGIPSYLIINKKGEQIYFSVGFEGVEVLSGKINEALNSARSFNDTL